MTGTPPVPDVPKSSLWIAVTAAAAVAVAWAVRRYGRAAITTTAAPAPVEQFYPQYAPDADEPDELSYDDDEPDAGPIVTFMGAR